MSTTATIVGELETPHRKLLKRESTDDSPAMSKGDGMWLKREVEDKGVVQSPPERPKLVDASAVVLTAHADTPTAVVASSGRWWCCAGSRR